HARQTGLNPSLVDMYKSFLSAINNNAKQSETGDTMWEALALEAAGFASVGFFFSKKVPAEQIIIDKLEEVKSTLYNETKPGKRCLAQDNMKRISFVLTYIEMGEAQHSDEAKRKRQLEFLNQMWNLLEE